MKIKLGKNQAEDVERFLDIRAETIRCGSTLGEPELDRIINLDWAEKKSVDAYNGRLTIDCEEEADYILYELENRLDIHEGNAPMCDESAKMARSIKKLINRVEKYE